MPEAKLARELEISYQVVGMVTDYDCWREHDEAVSVEAVLQHLRQNSETAKRLLLSVLPALLEQGGLKGIGRGAVKPGASRDAVITTKDVRSRQQAAVLNALMPHF
jgi:5'-methylthioadenosine phosphorylase